MSDEKKTYFTFANEEEVASIAKMVRNAPDLAWACVHIAEGRLNNNLFSLTESDLAALANFDLANPDIEVSNDSFNELGLAILQLIEDAEVVLPSQNLEDAEE